MLLYRSEGNQASEPIECDEDSTIVRMFRMVIETQAITFTRSDGDTVTWSTRP